MIQVNRKHSAMDLILTGGAAAGAVMLFLMQGMTTYTYDDYYYSLFLRDGFGGFLEQNITHYLVRNGRVLVHLAAELLLAGGSWVYSLANLMILAGTLGLGLRYLRGVDRADHRPLCLAAAVTLILTGTYRVFRSWLMCPADSMNYMLPFLPLLGLLLTLRGGGRRWFPAMVLALLSGATTELFSAMSFGIVALELLDERRRHGTWDRLRLVCLGCILCGMATIVLSPATRQRAGSELSIGGIGFSFLCYANSIAAPGTSLPLLAAASVLLGTAVPRRRWLHWSAIAVALLLLSGYVLPRSTQFTAAAFGVFCGYVLLCAAEMIFRSPHRRCGFALLAGLCSVAIMSLTSSGSVRVTIPFVLILLLCSVQFLSQAAEALRAIRPVTALALAAALLLQFPTLQGIAANHQIMEENESSVTARDISYTDYDPRYCTQQLFMSKDFQRVYLKYLNAEGAAVHYTYSYGPQVSVGGRAVDSIVYRGSVYLPLRSVTEAAGGSVRLISDSFLEIRLGDAYYLYQAPALHTPSGPVDVTWDIISLENSFYITVDLAEQALGIDPALWEE